jgi:hypothetical protein
MAHKIGTLSKQHWATGGQTRCGKRGERLRTSRNFLPIILSYLRRDTSIKICTNFDSIAVIVRMKTSRPGFFNKVGSHVVAP